MPEIAVHIALFVSILTLTQKSIAQFIPTTFWQKKQTVFACPSNYVVVPALSPYTTQDFCVAKYEMKNVGGIATSQASGTPWVNIKRNASITACQNLGVGYDLITNDQWQTIARNIADTDWNWSSGTAYSGQLNFGHSDGSPGIIAASTDNDACSGTGQSCSDTVWHSQRRTNKLSNESVVWDLGGNVSEWVKDNNSSSQGANGNVSIFSGGDSRQNNYGNDQFCSSPGAFPFCGFGYGFTDSAGGAIYRGASYIHFPDYSGVFSSNLQNPPSLKSSGVGFRCVSSGGL